MATTNSARTEGERCAEDATVRGGREWCAKDAAMHEGRERCVEDARTVCEGAWTALGRRGKNADERQTMRRCVDDRRRTSRRRVDCERTVNMRRVRNCLERSCASKFGRNWRREREKEKRERKN